MNKQIEILNDIVKYIHVNSIVNYDSFIFEYKFNPDEGWANFHLDYCKDNQSYLASIQDFGFSTLEDLSKKLHDEMKITVILVSHSMEDVAKYVDRIMVMNKGELIYDDVPKEVFKHYEALEQIGLAAPDVTYIMNDLYKAGFPVDTDAITVEEAKNSILKALGR